MDANELRRRFPNASAAFIAANLGESAGGGDARASVSPDSAGAGAIVERDCEDRAVVPRARKERDPRRFLVRLTSVRRRLLDEDNLCEKYHVDCCRYAGIIPDDAPGQVRIETSQRKAAKGEDEHTEIEVFEIMMPRTPIEDDGRGQGGLLA